MGSYREITGDLLALFAQGAFDFIGHGCNCFKAMDAGIARQIRKQFPEAKTADDQFAPVGKERLGKYVIAPNRIINIYSQYEPGKNLDTIALSEALSALNAELGPQKVSLGLPQIGCGIAGGNWSEIKPLIQDKLKDVELTVVVYAPSA